jgi:SAM-dependent methyltransferase
MDPYGDEELATLYDLFYSDYDEDVAMYDGFARRGETASLELGIGTGRIALRLARAGLDVVGIDAAPHMLRRLRAKLTAEPELAKRVRAIECDMRAFFLGERFDLIFCAANTLQHLLTSDDQISAFLSVARHLTTGGVFVAKLDSP